MTVLLPTAFKAARKADAKNERKPPTWQSFRSTLQAGSAFGRCVSLLSACVCIHA